MSQHDFYLARAAEARAARTERMRAKAESEKAQLILAAE